jgi:hypothetical protein
VEYGRDVQSNAAAIFLAAWSPALAQGTDAHVMLEPQNLNWGRAPPFIPPGAEAVVLYGDPGKGGLFALRLKLPKGHRIPPHTHSSWGQAPGRLRDPPTHPRRKP